MTFTNYLFNHQVILVFVLITTLLLIVQATDEALNVKLASPKDEINDMEVAETLYRKHKQYYNRKNYQQQQPVHVGKSYLLFVFVLTIIVCLVFILKSHELTQILTVFFSFWYSVCHRPCVCDKWRRKYS